MKLLIITQVVDSEHPILGFFHRWIEEFAAHCEQVQVICLEAGKQSLPANVSVYSLGKEVGKGRLVRIWRFYKYIWQLRHQYDSVFVHMNQIYVLLGAPVWRVWGKQIGLWYMHGTVSFSLRLAEKFTNHIFTGSTESFRLPSTKVVVTGHGIDTARFAKQTGPVDLDLITVGRITPAKNVHTLLDILSVVRKHYPVTLTIVGGAVTEAEQKYEAGLRSYVKENGLESAVIFAGKVPQSQLPHLLSRARVFVTTAQNGSLDKAILEAMACGLPVVSMAPGSASLPLGDDQVSSPEEFSERLKLLLQERTLVPEYRDYIVSQHSLEALIPKILRKYT